MPSESGDRRPMRVEQGGTGTQPLEPEQLPCPRCDSTNTKFCYYNNYNLSQPRHFCKSCRRYWTRGGTLRNVPVGGGSRRNPNKRSRSTTVAPSSSSSAITYDAANAIPIMADNKTDNDSPLCDGVNLNESLPETESFTSLLNPPGAEFFALRGFGAGAGSGFGFGDMGFGFGDRVWHMEVGGGSDSGDGSGSNSWQLGGVEGGLADGDCGGWPDLAISMSGNGLN